MFSHLSQETKVLIFFLSLLFLALLFVCIRVVILDRIPRREEKQRRLQDLEEKKRELDAKAAEQTHVPTRYDLRNVDYALLKSHAATLNRFAIKIFKELKSLNDPNLFISPYGISLGLALNLLDPECSNESEIMKLLQFDQQSKKKVLDSFVEYASFLSIFCIRRNYLTFHSLLFINTHQNKLSEDDESKCISEYLTLKGGLYIIDFESPDTTNFINNTISNSTRGKINNCINASSMNGKKVLINCCYFDADWTFKFDPRLTCSKKFFLNQHGDQIDTLYMIDNNYYQSHIHPCGVKVKTCRLSYRGNLIAMTIILPDEHVSLDEIENNLTYELVQYILKSPDSRIRAFNLELPRFGISRNYKNVNKCLDNISSKDSVHLGAKNAESVSNTNYFLHETLLEVGENGTERVNSYAERTTLRKKHQIRENISDFICNRPFIYIIHDTKYSGILFMGKLTNPLVE